MTKKQIVSKAMAILGSRSTPKKAAAARVNGKLGGRPKKLTDSMPHAKVNFIQNKQTDGLTRD